MEIAERDDPLERHQREHRGSGHLTDELGHERRHQAEAAALEQIRRHLREEKLEAAEHDHHPHDDRPHAAERVCRQDQRGRHHGVGAFA
jgi:hypothetical protein